MKREDLIVKLLEHLLGEERPNTEAVEIGAEEKGHDYDEYLGKNVFIRTVTNYYTGKVESTTKTTMTLSCACWIADTGRFNEAVATAEFSEVEPFKNNIKVSLLSFEDITEIDKLPEGVK